ncbi:uncharacterized protein PV06_02942 [Exophiala oligosperma]|uniref:Dynactin subunit 6 n=1 Tax=Exophiala oligosperma TaxID=215243 RepID=A0A0D2AXG3_9EURO|nr:uncharacterized protein PV06_02942 [Exophiala oligosperma]KIW44476.1 hypothetical protein PV06_02942 [Exophiala oligosperma]
MSTQHAHQPSQSTTSVTRPPVTVGQTTHLDPGAYVRGTHAITLGEHILIHPRSQLIGVHGPLSIGDKCIISEKAIIGGPVQTSSSTTDSSGRPPGGSAQPSPLIGQEVDDDNSDIDPVKTTIGSNVFIHASSQIQAGATIKDGVLIEPHVTVLAGVTVGSHAKVCAGVTVDHDVDEWCVIYGKGNIKRRRKQTGSNAADDDAAGHAEAVETMRLKAMDKEREGTTTILKMAARMATMAKKK